MTIGSERDARLAGMDNFFLAEGCSRVCYLINGVVYKVNTFPGQNRDEFENLNRLPNVPGIGIPSVAMYGDVLAMEYIQGRETGLCWDCEMGDPCQYGDCMPVSVANVLNQYGISDLSHGNVIERDGMFYIIDAAT